MIGKNLATVGAITPGNAYIIENHRFGVVVRGHIPINDFAALCKVWTQNGIDTLALGVATALDATFALCALADVEKWEAEINEQVQVIKQANDNAEPAWLYGTDTGGSSRTIFQVLASSCALRTVAEARNRFAAYLPSDPADFGRCHRLLERFPAWRERLPEVAGCFPEWRPLVDAWDELTALYLEELPTGKCSKLYDRMQELRETKLDQSFPKTLT